MAPVCQRSLCGNTFDEVDSFFAIRFDTFCNADEPLMRTALLPVVGMHVTLGRSGSQSSKHCIDKAAIILGDPPYCTRCLGKYGSSNTHT